MQKQGWGFESIGVWTLIYALEIALLLILFQALNESDEIVRNFLAGSITSLVSLFLVKRYIDKRGGFKKSLGLDKFKSSYLGKVGIYFLLYFGLLIFTSYLVSVLYPSFNLDQEQNFGFNQAATGWQLALAFVSLVIITPFVEEVIFRGLIFKGIDRDFGFFPALIISSGIFALLHGQINVAIDTFILGSIAAYLFKKTQSLWPAILLHGTKNLLAFIVIFMIDL